MGIFSKFKEKVADVIESTSDVFNFGKLKDGLAKTRNTLVYNLKSVLGVNRKIDASLIREIEDILISSDIGVSTTEKIIQGLKEKVKTIGIETSDDVLQILQEELLNILNTSIASAHHYDIDEATKPYSILIVGVNGVGKTTTIGKLAYNYKNAGKSVLIGAADTFRAAANEQLDIWAARAGVPIIQQKQGADPAAVAYDTLHSAISKNIDVVIIDTAGRLHNKLNLMSELEKINRVMNKLKSSAPDDVFLVLDATTGQNAIQQAKEFMKYAKITGIILTKLDGTAKGGVVIPIADELKIPVKFIGVGEKINDLQVFVPSQFISALFNSD
jgi:fused signal recognition particle receptor